MTTSPPTREELSDADLAGLAVDVLDAALSSASVDAIGVNNWWTRAGAALSAAASAGSTWPRICSTLARKLQIDDFSERDARTLAALGVHMSDPTILGRWCYIAARDTPYLVAMTRIRRADRTTARKPAAATPRPTTSQLEF